MAYAKPEIVNSASEARTHGVKALVYAKSGYGKTYLARTAPNPIILSAESGLLSLADVQLPVIKIKTLEDLNNIYSYLTESKEASQFQTIYIDSLSEIAESVLTNAKIVLKDQRQVYTKFIDDMLPLIKSFRDISGKHVIMTAKQESIKDDATGIILQGPMMPGNKLGQQLPYLFDEVFRLGIMQHGGNDYRFLQTAPDLQNDAKDRSGKLDKQERPDLSYIINKIIS